MPIFVQVFISRRLLPMDLYRQVHTLYVDKKNVFRI